MREGTPIGVIILWRKQVRPFTDKQIELVKNFADQAVIAIENTRLFDEAAAQRTRELAEALEQQTATSEVLRVISSSPGELEPVFQTMLENATRICDAKFGDLWLVRGETGSGSSRCMDAPAACVEMRRREPLIRPAGTAPLAACRTNQASCSHHRPQDGSGLCRTRPDVGCGLSMLAGARTVLMVPMLKENELIGVITIYRQEVGRSPTSRSSWSRTSPTRP